MAPKKRQRASPAASTSAGTPETLTLRPGPSESGPSLTGTRNTCTCIRS